MPKPKISVNKLGEYLQTNPQRRKTIIYDMKYPKSYKVARYIEAKEAIKNYFISNFDEEVLNASIYAHEAKKPESEFQEQDKQLSIELLEAMLDIELPDLTNYSVEIESYKDSNPKLDISGVDISVNPDLVIRGNYRNNKVIGIVKFHTSKTNSLNEEGRKTVATVLKRFTEEYVAQSDEKVFDRLCLSIDIFTNSHTIPPKSFKRKLDYIEIACEEIALRWASL